MNGTFKTELSKKLENLIGHTIGEEHIHSDKQGWHYYVPAKSIHIMHPLILVHYRGPLFVVIPYEDYELLDDGSISVENYVANAYWNFGYFWGGGSLLNGVYWQPFSEKPGIHDKEKIRRYLTILKCRTHFKSSGYMPSAESCTKCHVSACPFSKTKTESASWDKEVQEYDARKELFNAVKARIKRKFGFDCVGGLSHTGDTVLISPLENKDTVYMYLPQSLLIDMLYHPDKYDIEKTTTAFKFELCFCGGKPDRIIVPDVAGSQFCYDFWQCWKEPQMVENKTKEAKKITLLGKFKNFFGF